MKHTLGIALFALSLASAAGAAVTGVVVDDDGAPIAGASVRAFAAETQRATASRILAGQLERQPIAKADTGTDGAFRLDVAGAPLVTVTISAPDRVLMQFDASDGDDAGPLMLTAMKSHKLKITAGGKPLANAVLAAGSVWAGKTGADGMLDIPQIVGPFLNIAIFHPDYAPLTPGLIPQTPEISLSPGKSVRGRVVAEDGKTPVAHAAVSIGEWTRTETADDGTFTIAHAPQRWTTMRVSAPAGAAFVPQATTASYNIRLHPAASLSGSVRDAKRGTPVAGMRVSLAVRNDPAAGEAAITDAKGNFAFDAVPAGGYTINGTSSNHQLDSRSSLELQSGARDTRSMTATQFARVQGTVVDEAKKPIRGAMVTRGFGARLEGVARAAVTNARGEFTLRAPAGPAANENELQASKDGYAGATAKARVAAGETTTGVTITLTRGLALAIKVVDGDKKPVSGAHLAIAQWRNAPFGGSAPVMRCSGDNLCTTGDDGALTLRVAPGRYDISVSGDRLVAKTLNGQTVDEKTSPLTIVVEHGSEVSGRVVAADGAAVSDAQVTLQAQGLPQTITASTDASGAFSIFTAPRGAVTLQAALSRGSRLLSTKKEVNAPQTNVVLTMPRGGAISGRVLDDATRAPIAEFQVAAMHSGQLTPTMPFQADDGSFTIGELMAGSTDVQVSARGYSPAMVRGVEVEEGKTTSDVEVRLSRGATVKGRVTSNDGQPVDAVSVFADSGPGRRLIGGDRIATDANGNYTLEGVTPGTRRISFTKQGYAMAQKSVETVAGREATLDVVLDKGREIRGKVIDESGQPVAQADVRVEGEMLPPVRTDSDGTFVVGGLRDARYRVAARKSGYLEARDDNADPNGAPLLLTMRRGGTISGRVSGATEAELASAVVNVMGPGGSANGRVEPSGNFTISGLADGRFAIDATITGTPMRRSGRKNVDIVNGSAPPVDLSFAEGINVRGRVTQSGKPLANVTVGFTSSDPTAGGMSMGRTDADGVYAVSGLAAGDYNVFVMAAESGTVYNERATFSSNAAYDIDVRAAALRGRVVDASNGQPIADAQIMFQQLGNAASANMGVRPTSSDFSGHFVSDLVPEKKWRLRVQREKYETAFLDVDVVQGMPDVEVRMSPAIATTVRVAEGRNGAPVAGAYVNASDAPGRPVASATTADDGTAKVWLGPGHYVIHATAINYIGATAQTDVPGPVVQISLDRAGRIVVASPAGARVRLSGGTMTSPILAFNGRFDSVRPGSYVLELLTKENNTLQRKNITVVEGQTTTVTF